MKKLIISFILASVFATFFCACHSAQKAANTSDSTLEVNTTTEAETDTTVKTKRKPPIVKIFLRHTRIGLSKTFIIIMIREPMNCRHMRFLILTTMVRRSFSFGIFVWPRQPSVTYMSIAIIRLRAKPTISAQWLNLRDTL